MTRDEACALVKSLLERIDADRPAFAGLLSSLDRQALAVLAGVPAASGASSVIQPPVVPPPLSLVTSGLAQPVDSSVTLCLDFGTAKSKASAVVGEELISLSLGMLDGDVDGSVFAVASSIWIDESGLAFVGAEAVSRGEQRAADGRRQRLDSVKQFLSQAESLELLQCTTLPPAANPTTLTVSYEDAICLYLAYLTDLACLALEQAGHTRYPRRRFSLPSWKVEQRRWAVPLLARLMGRAQILADTFSGRWREGISVEHWLDANRQAKKYDTESLRWLIKDEDAAETDSRRWGAVLEPLAAGSASVWREVGRELVLVVDVGAGTSDFSLFLVTQGQAHAPGHRAFPVTPVADAVRFAGDRVDDVMLSEILKLGHIDHDSAVASHAKASIRLGGIRRVKERLFTDGSVDVTLPSDVVVRLDRESFLGCAGIRDFEQQLHANVRGFLERVDASFRPLFGNITLVLTGGGRDLPMVASLAKTAWSVHGTPVVFRPAPRIPQEFEDYGDGFGREYPQLAVAIGGARADVLDEKIALDNWAGGTQPPGKLSTFQTKGI